jgi:YD repeat-containing protein
LQSATKTGRTLAPLFTVTLHPTDPLGNPLSRSDANTNPSESFTYDALSRLTSTAATSVSWAEWSRLRPR